MTRAGATSIQQHKHLVIALTEFSNAQESEANGETSDFPGIWLRRNRVKWGTYKRKNGLKVRQGN